jgi:hypothetical protein
MVDQDEDLSGLRDVTARHQEVRSRIEKVISDLETFSSSIEEQRGQTSFSQTVQIFGLKGRETTTQEFLREIAGHNPGGIGKIDRMEIRYEDNYVPSKNGKLVRVRECFAQFSSSSITQAAKLLNLSEAQLFGLPLRFKEPERNAVMRDHFRIAGAALNRYEEIWNELNEIGVDWSSGVPKLKSDEYVDAKDMMDKIRSYKRARDNGWSVDRNVYAMLLREPIDIEKTKKRIEDLFNEMVDKLIFLRGCQALGMSFRFRAFGTR